MVILPRAEFQALQESAEHAVAIASYRSGRMPGLSPAETRQLIEAPSPLAFWRRRAGLTQKELAEKVGVKQGYLSDLENGRRAGPVEIWCKIGQALSVPIEALIDSE